MNVSLKRFKKFYVTWLLIYVGSACAASFGDSLEKTFGVSVDTQKVFFTSAEEKHERLEELKKEKNTWRAAQENLQNNNTVRIQEMKAIIDVLKTGLQEKGADTFLAAKLALINEDYQIIVTIQQLRERIDSLIDQVIAVLEDYLKDSNLAEYKKRLNIVFRERYTFAELQHINQLILDQKKSLESLKEQGKNIKIELKNYKHTSVATEQEHKQAKDEKSIFGASKQEVNEQKKRELLILEERLYTDKKERDTLRLKEIDYKNVLIKNKVFVQELHLAALKNIFAQIKPAIKVNEADIAHAQEEFAKIKQSSFSKKEKYQNERDAIVTEKKIKEQELLALSQRVSIALGELLDEWQVKPVQTIDGYSRYAEIVQSNQEVKFLEIKNNLLEAKIALEDELVHYDSIHLDVMHTVYKIITNKFAEDQSKKEIKKYETANAETQANISLFKERLSAVQEQLKKKKLAVRTLEELILHLQNEKDTIFKDRFVDHALVQEALTSTLSLIKQQVDMLVVLSSTYTDIITALERTERQLDFIATELQLITIWQRTEVAITWEGVENIIPNIQVFMADLHKNIIEFDGTVVLSRVKTVLKNPLEMLFLLFKLFLFLFVVFVIRWLLLLLIHALRIVGLEYRGLRFGMLLCILALEFVNSYLGLIIPWFALFLYIRFYASLDFHVYILFYLMSIPYLLYVARCFILYLQKFNEENKNVFFAPEFQRRFILVLSTSLYATIAILLLRKAYILHFYFGSELPEILFLVWIVILQISLIFLLTKDHILGVIPNQGIVWNWVRRKVDQYYYVVLIFFVAIMVMSNPFVGFDKLVVFVLSRSIYTIFTLGSLYWLNIFLRRGLSHIFFTTEYEIVRERFGYGKSLYGFFVIALFLIFIFFGSVLGAKVWGWPHELASIGQWSDVVGWLKTPILLKETAQISVFSVLQVLFFIFMGAIIAFVLNRFVLDKIFDILLVEPGVQNTVSSLIRYAIFIISVILGFQSIDLVAFVWGFIGALALGIGWIIKDPMGDFVAYFIILVQRPLKIGDYIKISDEITGVVRKITPRSVVLRRKNSTTIILPNSHVITKPLINWNYLRGFVAFDDIIVTVGYKEDPAFIQKLFLAVLAENQYLLKNPQPVVRLDNFSQYGFEFMVRGYISSNYTLDKWDIASAIRLAIALRLREHNIAIAVPSRIIISNDSNGLDFRNAEGNTGTFGKVPDNGKE